MTKKIEIRLETSKQNLEEEKAAAAASNEEFSVKKTEPASAPAGSPIARSHFVDLIAVTVATTVGHIAKRMFDNWQKDKQQGIQIDLRETPASISRIAGAPRGFLVVIDAKGKVKMEQLKFKEEGKLAEYINKILS